MNIKHTKDSKFEYVYFMDTPCVYASVQEPKSKLHKPTEKDKNKSENEYAITLFVTDEDREYLEDTVKINKQFFEVGKDKNKLRKIKYPLTKEDGEPTAFAPYKGLHGVQLTLNELSNKGTTNNLVVVDAQGKPFEEMVGNGSVVTVKLYGYRNQDELLNISMNLVMVKEHVPYEGGSGGGTITDDVLGITFDLNATKASDGIKTEMESLAGESQPAPDIDDTDF